MGGTIILIVILSVTLLASAIIGQYLYKTPKAVRQKEKKIDEFVFIKEYLKIKRENKHEKVLNFKIKCQNHNISVGLINVISAVEKDIDLDIVFQLLLKSKTSEFVLKFDDLFKIIEQNFDPIEYVEVFIDFANSGISVPLSKYLVHLQKGNSGRLFADSIIKSKKAAIELDANDVTANNLNDAQTEKIVHALIRAKKANIFLTEDERLNLNLTIDTDFKQSFKITKSKIFELHNAGKDVDIIVNAMIRAHESEVQIYLDALDIYTLKDEDFEKLVNNLIKAHKKGIVIDQEDVLHQNISGNDISKLVNAMLIAKKYELDLEFSELMDYHLLTSGNVLDFVNSIIIAKDNNLNLTKQYFIDMTVPNGDLIDLVNSIKIIEKFSNFNISRKDAEKHFKKKGKVFDVIKYTIQSQAQKLNLSFDLACEYDLSEQYNLVELIQMALHPLTVEVEPIQTIVTKDGIQVTPKVRVTWRGKIELLYNGYKEDVIFSRINEALIIEIEKYQDHRDVLNNLTKISKSVYNKLKGKTEIPHDASKEEAHEIKRLNEIEQEIDNNSAYEIHEITIYDIEIGKDIKVDIEEKLHKIKNHHEELSAQIKMLEAEAELRLSMAESYKNGEIPNFNEMHKDNIMKERKKENKH